MSPSRGATTALLRGSVSWCQLQRRAFFTFAEAVADASRTSQIYISRSQDPHVNLSIEHFLLQKSPPESTILFLYTNRPCIVIGRNQNPWQEVNLRLLDAPAQRGDHKLGVVDLVRRRSGGGTVFHDEGNVNYSVICPTSAFNRDKHAEMVVRALHSLEVSKAKVNERHDIILEGSSRPAVQKKIVEGEDSENIAEPSPEDVEMDQKPLKISGSAYKLTRLRSLHHGTCLLCSPNIHQISHYLRSPAKEFIKARGVNSVRSPVTNVNVDTKDFENAVCEEFTAMYDSEEAIILDGEEAQIPEIAKGLEELRSPEWTYLQTPQFTFSTHKTVNDPRDRSEPPDPISAAFNMHFTARGGKITEASLVFSQGINNMRHAKAAAENAASIIGRSIHEIDDWKPVIADGPEVMQRRAVGRWLNELFGKKA